MLKSRQPNLYEPSGQATKAQAVTPAHRILNPSRLEVERAAARRAIETRWRWYVQLVVNKSAGTR